MSPPKALAASIDLAPVQGPPAARRALGAGADVGVLVAVGVGIAGGVAAVHSPALLLAVVLVFLIPWLMSSPLRRFVLYAFGLVAVSGTTSAVSVTKVGYLGLLIVMGTIALLRLHRQDGLAGTSGFRRIRDGAWLLLASAMLSLLVGLLRGGDVFVVARESLPYFATAIGVFLVLDAHAEFKQFTVVNLTVVLSLLSAMSFMTFFLSARGVSTLSIAQIVLPSMILAGNAIAILFFYLLRSGPLLFLVRLALLDALLFMVLVTGTRTGLALFGGVVACLVGNATRGSIALRVTRAVGALALVFSCAVATLLRLGPYLTDPGFIERRIRTLQAIWDSGVESDQSGQSRVDAYHVAWQYFQQYPFFGNGSGVPYDYFGVQSFYLDTPLMFLAKFGVVGALFLLLGVGFVVRGSYQVAKSSGHQNGLARAVVVAVACIWILTIPASAIVEDKGFAVSMALMVALAFARVPASSTPDPATAGLPEATSSTEQPPPRTASAPTNAFTKTQEAPHGPS